MAAESITTKIQVRLQLNNGTTASGDVKTVAVTFPALSVSAYDVAKALAIADAVEPVLSKAVYKVEDVRTGQLQSE